MIIVNFLKILNINFNDSVFCECDFSNSDIDLTCDSEQQIKSLNSDFSNSNIKANTFVLDSKMDNFSKAVLEVDYISDSVIKNTNFSKTKIKTNTIFATNFENCDFSSCNLTFYDGEIDLSKCYTNKANIKKME